MNFSGLYEMQGMLFLLILLGAFLKRRGVITDGGSDMLSDMVIFVTLPASILKAFMIEFNQEILESCMAVFLVSCVIQAGVFVLNLFLYRNLNRERKSVLQYATMCSNAGILGNPIAEGIFGSIGLLYASIYLIPQRILMWSLGMTYFTESPNLKTLVKKIVTHPCIVSVAVGFGLMIWQVPLPGFLKATITSVSNANTPLSMIFIGTILANVDWKSMVTKVTLGYSLLRLVLIPLAVLSGCLAAGLEGVALGICVVLAGMPAASVSVILASKYGADREFATKCVILSTLFSIVTIPAWCLILG